MTANTADNSPRQRPAFLITNDFEVPAELAGRQLCQAVAFRKRDRLGGKVYPSQCHVVVDLDQDCWDHHRYYGYPLLQSGPAIAMS